MKTTEKKNYITPSIETHKVELQHVIAESFTPSDTTTTGSVTNDEYNGTFSSRESGFWDED